MSQSLDYHQYHQFKGQLTLTWRLMCASMLVAGKPLKQNDMGIPKDWQPISQTHATKMLTDLAKNIFMDEQDTVDIDNSTCLQRLNTH